VKTFMEPRFAADFSSVRVHADAAAARSAESVHARAFTLGEHIVFAAGEYAPESSGGRTLIAHELTHVLQQRGGMRRVQRAVTRGAGGCGPLDAIDEDDTGTRGAGSQAHAQIQSFLLPRVIPEVEIPRATKQAIASTGCQGPDIQPGRADLYLRGGSTHEIAEIKPFRRDMSHAVAETDHYMRRASQATDRFFGLGAQCPGSASGADDVSFARRIGISRLNPTFARMNGVLSSDTVIGAFDGDQARTLKARLQAPGAVGYWCTGGASNTYTCGVSEEETARYIDRIALAPAQSLLDEFIRVNVEQRLQRALQSRSLGDILSIAEQHFGSTIREQLRPLLGPAADTIISRASAEEIGRLIEEQIGPEARAIVTTLIRRFVSIVVAELRTAMRNALTSLIRETLLALCVGVPAVTLAELMDRLRQSLRESARSLIPVAVVAAAARIAATISAELATMVAELVAALGRALGAIGRALLFLAELLVRAVAVIVLLLLAAGVIVLGVLALLTIFDPVPGDELALGAATVALAALIPVVGRFILTGSTEETDDGA
jgi:hypothetical protein